MIGPCFGKVMNSFNNSFEGNVQSDEFHKTEEVGETLAKLLKFESQSGGGGIVLVGSDGGVDLFRVEGREQTKRYVA